MKKSSKINYLIITSSGGSGNLHGAEAQKQMIEKNEPEAKVIVKDFMLDWLGLIMGNFGVIAWNTAQKRGSVTIQRLLGSCLKIFNKLFWPKIFISAFKDLLKYDIDYVIHVQALGLSAIIKAIRLYNKIKRKKVFLKVIFVDLPAKKSHHYFQPIKALSKKDKKYLIVSSIEPPLEHNQTEKDFWIDTCDLTFDKVFYEPYPIRQSFYKFEHKKRKNGNYSININFQTDIEAGYIEKIVSKSQCIWIKKNKHFEFIIEPNDYLATLILGSKPCFKAICNYIKNIIFFMKNHKIDKKIWLFSYCSLSKDPLIKKIFHRIEKVYDFPKNLIIVPMSFQPEDVIALLYHRSDLTITRSAGQTAMELLKVSQAKHFVHTECNLHVKEADIKKLLKGIPLWESGIAEYMVQKMQASLINPDSFIDVFKDQII
jgi:hypothetical protein